MVFLMTVKMMNIVASTQAATLTMPSSWMPSLVRAAAVEQAALGGKQADGDACPTQPFMQCTETAPTGSSILAIVVEELNREDAEHTGDDADDGRAERDQRRRSPR